MEHKPNQDTARLVQGIQKLIQASDAHNLPMKLVMNKVTFTKVPRGIVKKTGDIGLQIPVSIFNVPVDLDNCIPWGNMICVDLTHPNSDDIDKMITNPDKTYSVISASLQMRIRGKDWIDNPKFKDLVYGQKGEEHNGS